MNDDMMTVKADGFHAPVNLFLNGEEVSMKAIEFYGSVEPFKVVKGWVELLEESERRFVIGSDGNFLSRRIEGAVYWIPINASST